MKTIQESEESSRNASTKMAKMKKLSIIWTKPNLRDETGEYFENQLTKDWLQEHGIVFENEQELIEAFSKGNLEMITLRQLRNSANTTINSMDFELELVDKEYRKSFESMEAKLVNEGTIRLPAPIILRVDGTYFGFAGNRRMNLAFKYGLPLKVWLVEDKIEKLAKEIISSNESQQIEVRNLSFSEFKRLTDEIIHSFDLHQEMLQKNNDDLSGWKNRKFTGFFIDKEFVGYISFYDRYVVRDERGQLDTVDTGGIPVLYFSTFEIASDKRGGGIGTRIMDKFMSEHRSENIALRAHAENLISYYERFGFKLVNKESGNLMVRMK